MIPPPELKARVLAAIATEPAPSRPEVVRRTVFAWMFAVTATLGIFFVVGGAHAAARPVPFVGATLAGWLAIAVAATLGVARRGTMLGRSHVALLAWPLGLPPALVGWYILCLSRGSIAPSPVPLLRGGVCLLLTFAMGAVLLAAFVRSRRGSDPVHPAAMGAAAGAMAGAWASVLIDLHCDSAELLHVMVGHVSPVLLLAGVGAVVGQRLLRVRLDTSNSNAGSNAGSNPGSNAGSNLG